MDAKKITVSLLAISMLAIPVAAQAYHHEDDRMYHGYCQGWQLTAAQQTEMEKILTEREKNAEPLFDRMMEKRMELKALSSNPNVKPDELRSIIAEITSLRKQLNNINKNSIAQMDKAGIPHSPHGMMHHGMRGAGHRGMGPWMDNGCNF